MIEIKFKLNEEEVVLNDNPTRRLLDVLKEDFDLTGLKEGCGEGECGGCAILLDHKIVNSCVTPLGNVNGREVVTIEGYAKTKRYKALAAAFAEQGSVQCGACTPGILIACESLLNENNSPTEEEIRVALSGNLCRCTGYNMIVKAVHLAIEREGSLWESM